MKLLSLNIWGGRVYEPFINFLKKHAGEVDIFCIQEAYLSPLKDYVSHGVHVTIFDDMVNILKGYQPFFGPVQDRFDDEGAVDFEVTSGQATFIKEAVTIDSFEHIFVYRERNSAVPDDPNSIPAAMLCTRIQSGKKKYTVCNIHGFSYPGTKLDTKERIEQSEKILHFLKGEKGREIILCGDFNLMPSTKSMEMLEDKLENLIKKFNVLNTRSSLSYYANTPDAQKFADYTLVSPNIKAKDFKILQDQVSDHLAMYLDFE